MLKNQTEIAIFENSTGAKANNLIEDEPWLISLAEMSNLDEFAGELTRVIQAFTFQKSDTRTFRPPADHLEL